MFGNYKINISAKLILPFKVVTFAIVWPCLAHDHESSLCPSILAACGIGMLSWGEVNMN